MRGARMITEDPARPKRIVAKRRYFVAIWLPEAQVGGIFFGNR
jgi:hypothetical protein